MTAHEVIVQVMGNTFGTGDEYARDILGALQAAGYAVVELPKPNSLDAWPVMFGGETEDVYGKTNGDVVISGVDTMSACLARALAGALLAAADAAEAS